MKTGGSEQKAIRLMLPGSRFCVLKLL